jgi:hypothetical protein
VRQHNIKIWHIKLWNTRIQKQSHIME